jgi:drug/metabolite transporter (DMT)-like permease
LSIAVFLWVLTAALLHAIWNAMVKTGGNKVTGMLMVALGNGALGLAVVATRPLPGADIWPWLVASGFIRMLYLAFLGHAYEHGDLSRVYPIARGAAPLFVLAVGGFFLADVISRAEFIGILVLGAGILLMTRGVFSNGESRRLVPFALGSALATASYSIVDGIGARLSGDPIAFVGWALFATAVFYLPVAVMIKGAGVLRADKRSWINGAIAGVASYAAYTIVVWAMTKAPIALVTALRETSILFAVLIGWLLFSERMDRGKVVAALLIVGGVALTRI